MPNAGPVAAVVCPGRKTKGRQGDSVRFLAAGLFPKHPLERITEMSSATNGNHQDDEDDDIDMLRLLAENVADLAGWVRSLNLSVRLMTTVLRNELRDRAERRETRQ